MNSESYRNSLRLSRGLKVRSSFVIMICLFVFPINFVLGCAQLYDGLQAVSVDSCYNLPYSEQQDCLEQVRSSREEYEQNRKANTLH